MKLFLKRTLGVLCLVYGIIALVTPFTPGALLIFVGLELLGLTFLLPKSVLKYLDIVKRKLSGKSHEETNANPEKNAD
jgi:uncharacterized protein YqgC (DUF456 family)